MNCLWGEHLPAKGVWPHEEVIHVCGWLTVSLWPGAGAGEEVDVSAHKKGKRWRLQNEMALSGSKGSCRLRNTALINLRKRKKWKSWLFSLTFT